MREELDFTEYSHRLGEGLFADKVVLALSRFARTRELDEEMRQTLKDAEAFLTDVIEGSKSSPGSFRSSQDAASAKAFTHAVDAIAIPISSKEEFLKYLGELHTTVLKLSANEEGTSEELARVDAFFSRYGQIQFQRSKKMLASV